MFRKLALPLIATLVLLAGCLTSDYNLRVINDTDRYYEGVYSDSTSTLMKWNTPEWKAKNVKYWRSGGVIITNAYNAFFENSWLKDLLDAGFEGQVFVEDMTEDLIQTGFGSIPWNVAPDYSWFFRLYTPKIANFGAGLVLENGSSVWVSKSGAVPASRFPFSSSNEWYTKPYFWYTDPDYGSEVAAVWNAEFDLVSAALGDTAGNIRWGICMNDYEYDSWTFYDQYINDDTVDPAELGKNLSSYTVEEYTTWLHRWQSAKLTAYNLADIEVIVKGDRLTTELASNVDLIGGRITGYFFDDVNTSNISTVETQIAALRSVNEALLPSQALLLIAGVKNDVYHESSPTVYAQLIQRLVNAGMYFTPGADNDHWNMPITNPGDWWIRNDNDSNWQANAPTYASYSEGPRKIMLGAEEVYVYNTFVDQVGQGGGGWLDAGAIGINDQYILLGSDISGAYYSDDYGVSFEHLSDGMDNEDDRETHYVNDIVAVSNIYFDGFVVADHGGMFSLADGSKTFVDMTPLSNSKGWYTVESPMGLQYADGYPNLEPRNGALGWAEGWVEAMPFHAVAWDGNNYLVAATGKYRWSATSEDNINAEWLEYPQSMMEVNWHNPLGRVGFMYYNYAEGLSAAWKPLGGKNSWVPEFGNYRDLCVKVAGTDTTVVVATAQAGPQLYDVDADTWTNLAGEKWIGPDGSELIPNWGINPNSTTDYQSSEMIWLTDRNTAYVSINNGSNQYYPFVSGIYRYHDVTAASGTYNWEWVGDQTAMPWNLYGNETPSYTVNEFASGGLPPYSSGYKSHVGEFVFFTVVEGTGTDPDLLYVGERRSNYGLSKISVPYGEGVGYDQSQTWEPMFWTSAYVNDQGIRPSGVGLFDGYGSGLGWSGIQFEPMVNPNDSDDIIAIRSVYAHRTTDGGATWTNMAPIKTFGTDKWNESIGWDETCTNEIIVMDNGHMAFSSADIGLAISYDAEDWEIFQSHLDWFTVANFTKSTREDVPEHFSGTKETGSGLWQDGDWNGTGHQALMFVANKKVGLSGHAALTLVLDEDDDGVFDDVATDILYDIANGGDLATYDPDGIAQNRGFYLFPYKFSGIRHAADDVEWYIPYFVDSSFTTLTGSVVWDRAGVVRLWWNGTRFGIEYFDNFYDFDYATGLVAGWGLQSRSSYRAMDGGLLYSSAHNMLFLCENGWASGLAAGDPGSPYGSGHIWVCDLDDVTPEWRAMLGRNSPEEYARDPRAIALSSDGTVLYVGGRGQQAIGNTGVWKVTNLDNKTGDWYTPTIEWVVNGQYDTVSPNMKTPWFPPAPSRYGEILSDRWWPDREDGTYLRMWDDSSNISGLAVNPLDNDQLFFSFDMYANHNTNWGYLWAIDTSPELDTYPLTRATWTEKDGDIARYTDENIVIDTSRSPYRIVHGTDCIGVRWSYWNGIFPTDEYDEYEVTPTTTINKITGVRAIAYDDTVRVFWNDMPNPINTNLCGYAVYKSTDGSVFTQMTDPTVSGGDTAYRADPSSDYGWVWEDTDVTNGTQYWYRVRPAVGDVACSDGSTVVASVSETVGPVVPYSSGPTSTEKIGTQWVWSSSFIDTVSITAPLAYPDQTKTAYGFVSNTSAAFQQIRWPTTITAPNDNVTVSAYVKMYGGRPMDGHMRFYNAGGNTYYKQWQWNVDGTISADAGDVNDGGGFIDVGNGWYRVWMTIDMATRGEAGNAFDVRFVPWEGNTNTGIGCYIWGVQYDEGATEPRTYRPKDPMVAHNKPVNQRKIYPWDNVWKNTWSEWRDDEGCDEAAGKFQYVFPTNDADTDSGSVDFAFVYDDSTGYFHHIGIPGGELSWTSRIGVGNATWFEHQRSTDLVHWERMDNIVLYDASYAVTNVWAPHIIKYDDVWYMFYTAVDATSGAASNQQRIMVAKSNDLYTWTDNALVLEADDYHSSVVTPFTNYVVPATTWGEGDCRDPHIIRNEDNDGWTMFVSVNGDVSHPSMTWGGLVIGIARTWDSDYANDPAASLVGTYQMYDFVDQTSNNAYGAYNGESPHVWVEDGLYTLEWATNTGAPYESGMACTTTTPSLGTLNGNAWGTAWNFPYKAIEMITMKSGDRLFSWLDNHPNPLLYNGVDKFYLATSYGRYYNVPLGTDEFYYVMNPACYEWVTTQPKMTPIAIPRAPAGVTASVSSGNVTISWDWPTETDVRYFNIYRGTVSGSLSLYYSYELYGEEWRTRLPTKWYDKDQASNTYYYAVTFVNYDDTESPQSDEVSAVVP